MSVNAIKCQLKHNRDQDLKLHCRQLMIMPWTATRDDRLSAHSCFMEQQLACCRVKVLVQAELLSTVWTLQTWHKVRSNESLWPLLPWRLSHVYAVSSMIVGRMYHSVKWPPPPTSEALNGYLCMDMSFKTRKMNVEKLEHVEFVKITRQGHSKNVSKIHFDTM